MKNYGQYGFEHYHEEVKKHLSFDDLDEEDSKEFANFSIRSLIIAAAIGFTVSLLSIWAFCLMFL